MNALPYEVYVLRLGHRVERDKRITTHVCLVARAFGARGVYISGDVDNKLIHKLRDVSEKWGGEFLVECGVDPIKLIKSWKKGGGEVVHLTMYGMPLDYVIASVKASSSRKLVVVGAEKVPPIIYKLSDYNVSVGGQPHSEVSALAVFLDRLFEGRELYTKFEGAKVRVIPTSKGKVLEEVKRKSEQQRLNSKSCGQDVRRENY